VALAWAGGDWPHEDWPGPDDQYVRSVLHVSPPYQALRNMRVDVVMLWCADPRRALPELRDAIGGADGMDAPVIVLSPCRKPEVIVEVFQTGAGYLVDGDYITSMLSPVAMGAAVGHTPLSPVASNAVRDATQQACDTCEEPEAERLRALLSPRERQIMDLLTTGMSVPEIAQRLELRAKTVRNNLSNVYAKLDVRGSTEAVLRWLGGRS
jgi:DNA-binding NarL/FixJ family response regulator